MSWKYLTFDNLVSSTQIGIVRNTKEQSVDFPVRYFKMNNIKNNNGIDDSKYTSINATEDEIRKYSLKNGDFLFNTRNSYELVGKTCVFRSSDNEPIVFNNNILRARFKDLVSSDFVAYAFCTEKVKIKLNNIKNGTTSVVGIYYKSLKDLKIPVPPLSEQKQIVETLDKTFEKIDKAIANIERNIENAEELFESKLNKIFSQISNKSENKKLKEVIKTGAGGTPLKSKKEYYLNGNIPWIRSGEVNNKNIIDSEIKITNSGLKNSSAKLFPPKTVVIAMYGATAGQVGILNFECSSNQAVCGLYPNNNFLPDFLYYKFLDYKEILKSQAVGGAQPNISQQKIKEVLIPILSVSEQKKIVEKLDLINNDVQLLLLNFKKRLKSLEELKKSILEKAFKGELTSAA